MRQVNNTTMYDICHRVHVLSEGVGTSVLFPASTALLDGPGLALEYRLPRLIAVLPFVGCKAGDAPRINDHLPKARRGREGQPRGVKCVFRHGVGKGSNRHSVCNHMSCIKYGTTDRKALKCLNYSICSWNHKPCHSLALHNERNSLDHQAE